jgi:ATP-binding cassette subfamily B protein
MAKQGAYWRLYEAQARRVDTDENDDNRLPEPSHTAHPAGTS